MDLNLCNPDSGTCENYNIGLKIQKGYPYIINLRVCMVSLGFAVLFLRFIFLVSSLSAITSFLQCKSFIELLVLGKIPLDYLDYSI